MSEQDTIEELTRRTRAGAIAWTTWRSGDMVAIIDGVRHVVMEDRDALVVVAAGAGLSVTRGGKDITALANAVAKVATPYVEEISSTRGRRRNKKAMEMKESLPSIERQAKRDRVSLQPALIE